MKERIKLDNKYEVVLINNGKEFKAFRNGEEWRNLAGDGLVLAMFYKIQELETELDKRNVSTNINDVHSYVVKNNYSHEEEKILYFGQILDINGKPISYNGALLNNLYPSYDESLTRRKTENKFKEIANLLF